MHTYGNLLIVSCRYIPSSCVRCSRPNPIAAAKDGCASVRSTDNNGAWREAIEGSWVWCCGQECDMRVRLGGECFRIVPGLGARRTYAARTRACFRACLPALLRGVAYAKPPNREARER